MSSEGFEANSGMADKQEPDEAARIRFSVRQLLTISTLTCIGLGVGVGGLMLVVFLASSFLPGIVLLAALTVPQLLLFLALRRWLPKVDRDPIVDE